ncbi:hypothetical protein O6H91_15G000900 [Diphasiastrum complanatum]|nr:hypothetical protein O6H91_15G000900 [Diphasiastrum complanatum]
MLHFFYPHVVHDDNFKESKLQLDRLRQRRDLFLLAFEAVQNLPPTDKWSFYQIAGIHGLPYEPYDGDTASIWEETGGDKWWGGYCQHGSPLFPTWHRPYVMLLEQSVIRQAKLLAETAFGDPDEKKAVEAIADQLRFPFWDWANHSTRMTGIPDIFTSTEIFLAYQWKSFSRTKIPNPLKSFVLPKNVGKITASSDVFNPAAKPNYVVPSEGVPFSPLGYPTVRYVNASYMSQNDKMNVALIRNVNGTAVEGVHAVFHHNDWLSFSNHYWSEAPGHKQYGHYTSVELVHDGLHTYIGGPGGHMAHPDVAAFDPVFFFHHANVDRLVALWQYCYPNKWIDDKLQPMDDGTYTIKPAPDATSDTDLTPFRRSQKDEFVSSNDVRTVDVDCGYTYPEIQLARKEMWGPGKMLNHLLELYRPPQHFVHRWFLVLEKILKRAFGGPYSIRVFIDMPDATANTPLSDPHFAGDICIFARSNNVRCANCDRYKYMRGSVNLTKTMVRLGIKTAQEVNDAGTAPTGNPLSHADAITLVYVDSKGDQLNPASIGWGGPNRSIYFQEGVKDENIQDFLVQQVNSATLPLKPAVRYELQS